MASQIRELKSILKPPRSSHTPGQKSRAEAERIALAHARIIQQQKDLELTILSAIETLSTYPASRSPSLSASSPSPADASTFKSLIRPFQPSDYDDLVEERNILGNCGYALCPKPRRSTDQMGKFTLVNHNRPDFAIVETKDVAKWCSDRCARRALYVKVQLSETAAWERAAMPEVKIDLLDEEGEEDGMGGKDAGLARDVARLKLGEERKARGDRAALSLERGDVLERGDEERRRQVPLAPKMELSIREKEITRTAKPPVQEGEVDGGSVEGHRSIFGNGAEDDAESEEDDHDSGFEEERHA
ncbi:DUF408 domain protein [Coniochaeta hoffmannii]|uniref:RNA polymerase II subunit B1 CTD phosphatase RPAP2 homolog n=1 Tax=Coniochaeta hoffmannii TaxID=91930 RepID=A0AA38RCJ1_9PEZI|nr:DUF408 domain protein [Coniochaeta hoffmannii]